MANNTVFKTSRANIKRDIKGKARSLRKHLFGPVFIYVLVQAIVFNRQYLYIIFPAVFSKLMPSKAVYMHYSNLISWVFFFLRTFTNTLILGFAAIGFFCIIQNLLKDTPSPHIKSSTVFSYYKQVIIFSLLITLVLFCIHILYNITMDLLSIPGITSTLISIPYINLSILGIIKIALQLITFLLFILSLRHVINQPKLSVIECLKSYQKFIASRLVFIIKLNISILMFLAIAACIIFLFTIGASVIIGLFGFGYAISGGVAPVAMIAIYLSILALLMWLSASSVNIITSYCLLFINSVYQHLHAERYSRSPLSTRIVGQ